MNEQWSEAFCLVAQLAEKLDAVPLDKHPNCWECQIDDRWRISVNGHGEEQKTASGSAVLPFHCYVEFRGFPAGILHPHGGTMVAHVEGSEDAFIRAMKARLKCPN